MVLKPQERPTFLPGREAAGIPGMAPGGGTFGPDKEELGFDRAAELGLCRVANRGSKGH